MNKRFTSKKLKKASSILIVVLVLVLIATIALAVVKAIEKPKDKLDPDSVLPNKKEKWQEGIITYNGKNYKYNKDLTIYLLMGIDKEGIVTTSLDSVSGGQADALFLLIADNSTKTMKVFAIHRNTMADIETYLPSGKHVGTVKAQICTQHGFGDGKKTSCVRTVNAVEKLFYDIPISGYISLNMGGIRALNDAVGGVEVTVLDDITSKDIELVKDTVVTLSGEEAYQYLRSREKDEFDSATNRLERQKQYISAYLTKVRDIKDSIDASNMYDDLSDYMVTDVIFSNVVDKFIDYEFDTSNIYTIPGHTELNGEFEEFIVDDVSFYEMILKVFYIEK